MKVWLLFKMATMISLSLTGAFAENITNNSPLDLDSTKLGKIQYFNPSTGEVAKEVAITKDDVLWAARMIEGEGGAPNAEHGAAILWTVLQRGWCSDFRHDLSLVKQMQTFSQPINPIWTCSVKTKIGCARFCDKSRKDYIDPTSPKAVGTSCSQERINKRITRMQKPWNRIDKRARRIALQFARGELANPIPGITDFAKDCIASNKNEFRKAYSYPYKGKGRTKSCKGVNTMFYKSCKNRLLVNENGSWSDSWTGAEVRLVNHDGALSVFARENIDQSTMPKSSIQVGLPENDQPAAEAVR